MMITQKLAEILGDVDRPGDFFASGRAEFLVPRLEVEGVGPIALPLLPAQGKRLIKAAARAPYGRGADTIVDMKVRSTWQIEASRVSIGGKHWANTLDGIVKRAAEGLGVAEPVVAELYKLLVYDKGCFFISHRDTEKTPGMSRRWCWLRHRSRRVASWSCAIRTAKPGWILPARSRPRSRSRRSMRTAYMRSCR